MLFIQVDQSNQLLNLLQVQLRVLKDRLVYQISVPCLE
jgi:hypothetical protein